MKSKWEKFASKFFDQKSLVEVIAELRKEKVEAEKRRLEAEQQAEIDEENESKERSKK